MSWKLPPAAREHHHHNQWAPALCRLSSVLFILSILLLWGSWSISRGSQKLTAQHSYERSLLLPGFHQLEHQHLSTQLSGFQIVTSVTVDAAAAAAQEQQPEQQELQPLLSDVPGHSGPPFILPKLIHQTVKDKNSMSCEVQESIQSWIDKNPGYTHILYDDADLLDFVKEHYPQLEGIYRALPTNIERTDTWRYLVLHKLGGVYADSDVKCMQPISTWNQENSFDAALMVGIAKRNMKTGDTKEFNQFVIAAMPGHPVLATMPMVIAGNLAYTYLKGLPLKGQGKAADEAILMRTGPKAFTSALQAYAQRVGAKWPVNSTKADQESGVLFGTVRAMPKFVLGTGWDTLDHNMTCEEVKQSIRPEALICHQFFGSWKTRPEKQLQLRQFTYGNCNRGDGELQLPGADTNHVIDHAQDTGEAGEAAAEAVADAGAGAGAAANAAGVEQQAVVRYVDQREGSAGGEQTLPGRVGANEGEAARGTGSVSDTDTAGAGAAAAADTAAAEATATADLEAAAAAAVAAAAADGGPSVAAADAAEGGTEDVIATAALPDDVPVDAAAAADPLAAADGVIVTAAVPDDDGVTSDAAGAAAADPVAAADTAAAAAEADSATESLQQGPSVVTYTAADSAGMPSDATQQQQQQEQQQGAALGEWPEEQQQEQQPEQEQPEQQGEEEQPMLQPQQQQVPEQEPLPPQDQQEQQLQAQYETIQQQLQRLQAQHHMLPQPQQQPQLQALPRRTLVRAQYSSSSSSSNESTSSAHEGG